MMRGKFREPVYSVDEKGNFLNLSKKIINEKK